MGETGVPQGRNVPAPFGLFFIGIFSLGKIINTSYFWAEGAINVLSSHKQAHAHKHIWRLDLKLHYSGTFYYDLFTVRLELTHSVWLRVWEEGWKWKEGANAVQARAKENRCDWQVFPFKYILHDAANKCLQCSVKGCKFRRRGFMEGRFLTRKRGNTCLRRSCDHWNIK